MCITMLDQSDAILSARIQTVEIKRRDESFVAEAPQWSLPHPIFRTDINAGLNPDDRMLPRLYNAMVLTMPERV